MKKKVGFLLPMFFLMFVVLTLSVVLWVSDSDIQNSQEVSVFLFVAVIAAFISLVDRLICPIPFRYRKMRLQVLGLTVRQLMWLLRASDYHLNFQNGRFSYSNGNFMVEYDFEAQQLYFLLNSNNEWLVFYYALLSNTVTPLTAFESCSLDYKYLVAEFLTTLKKKDKRVMASVTVSPGN